MGVMESSLIIQNIISAGGIHAQLSSLPSKSSMHSYGSGDNIYIYVWFLSSMPTVPLIVLMVNRAH